MYRLIIETSNLDFQTALHDGAQFAYRSDQDDEANGMELSGQLKRGLAASGTQMSDIGEIIVDVGPGGLTSTRSGIAFANGLTFALKIPIVEVNSLELMVLQAGLDTHENVVSARRSNDGKSFLGFYHSGKCQHLALGVAEDLVRARNWQNDAITWVGPVPKNWDDIDGQFNITRIDLQSPGLEAFAAIIADEGFAARPRLTAAGPINETIR